MKTLKSFFCISVTISLLVSCVKVESVPVDIPDGDEENYSFSLQDVARIMSSLPLQTEHLTEVYNAVNCSSSNGYDEEYTLKDLFENPGSGVGGSETKARTYSNPLRGLIENYLRESILTKSGAADVQKYISSLSESEMQIYWPYSEDWDGKTLPIVTFDPGYGTESNFGYVLSKGEGGVHVVDSILVTEALAQTRPVWVINRNDDSGFSTLKMLSRKTSTSSCNKKLILKKFKMLRNYDSWFAGASEFFVKCGAVDGFTASTEEELQLFKPSITDFLVVVKRKYVGKELDLDCMLMTDFTDQLDKLAFMITEDDGGTQTSWKCSASVKIKSKAYGFDIDFPFNSKDDIVWRGQLSADFFRETTEVSGRFGDVVTTFALE